MRWTINAACMFVIGLTLAGNGLDFSNSAYWLILGAAAVPAAMQEISS